MNHQVPFLSSEPGVKYPEMRKKDARTQVLPTPMRMLRTILVKGSSRY